MIVLTGGMVCIKPLQNEKLTEQNKALRMNISCLYKTARSELDRKEAMIVGLVTRCVCECVCVCERERERERERVYINVQMCVCNNLSNCGCWC